MDALQEQRDALAAPRVGDVDVPLIPCVPLETMSARQMTELEPGGLLTGARLVRGAWKRDLGREPRPEPSAELAAHLGGIESEAPRTGEIARGLRRRRIDFAGTGQRGGKAGPERRRAECESGSTGGSQEVASVHRDPLRVMERGYRAGALQYCTAEVDVVKPVGVERDQGVQRLRDVSRVSAVGCAFTFRRQTVTFERWRAIFAP